MNTEPPAQGLEIMKKIYAGGRCGPGWAVIALASATSCSAEMSALAVAAVLGGIAGPDAHILGPADNPISPAFNTFVAGSDNSAFLNLQMLVLEPVQALLSRLRQMSQIVEPDHLLIQRKPLQKPNQTEELLKIVGKEINTKGFQLGPLHDVRASQALGQPSILRNSPAPEVFRTGIEKILNQGDPGSTRRHRLTIAGKCP